MQKVKYILLFKEVAFDMAYIFKYSPRPATEAASSEEMIPEEDELPLEDEKLLFDEEDLLSAEADTAYEEAVKLLRTCSASIDLVEKKVMMLNEEGGLDEL